MTPFAAYLAAEALGVSGVLSVVAAGLYSGWRDPVRTDVETRQSTFAVWRLLLFWLNGIAFVLLGLQFPSLLAAVSGHYSTGQLLVFTAVVAGAAIASRMIWVYSSVYLPYLVTGICTKERQLRLGALRVWLGPACAARSRSPARCRFRSCCLARRLARFPGRDIVIFLAFGVIAVTLLVQGTTLERLIQRLGLREDDTRAQEERLARTSAVDAGLVALRALETEAATPDHQAAHRPEVIAEYEHTASPPWYRRGQRRASAPAAGARRPPLPHDRPARRAPHRGRAVAQRRIADEVPPSAPAVARPRGSHAPRRPAATGGIGRGTIPVAAQSKLARSKTIAP